MTDVLRIRGHDELISSIPHTMGFTPRGMLCVAFGDGPSSRVDLPESPEEMGQFVSVLTDVYLRRHHPQRVALVAYGEDGRACIEALVALGGALVADPVRGPELGPMLWVNGEEWTDLLAGTHGTVDPGVRARIDAEFAFRGRVMPAARREDLAAALRGDPTAVAAHLPAAEARAAQMDVAAGRLEVGWLAARVDQFRGDREYLSDADAARVLAVLQDSGARDTAASTMTRQDAPVLSELWEDLVRRAPVAVRDNPATLLALTCFLEGRGAHAWVALSQVAANNPLADALGEALEQAADPRGWDRTAPPAGGALLQQAALGDAPTRERRAWDQHHNTPGVDDPDPASPPPGR